MLVLDLTLFGCLFLSQIFIFFFLQIIILRLFTNRDLLYSSVFTAFLSVFLVIISSYFLIADHFSSMESFVLSAAGSGLAAIFACGLYTFLGPVTADRSLASQLLVLLHNMPSATIPRDDLFPLFNSVGFIEKRIDECKKEAIIVERNDSIILTEKGKRIAGMYIFLLRAINMCERKEYKQYFRNGSET